MQKAQALSTAEAKYVALCAATQDGAFFIQMLAEIGMGDNAPITILEDSQACISVGTKDIVSPKLKHIDIKFHYVRTMVQENKIKLVYCPTFHQAAGILTKGTDKLTFIRHRSTLMGLPSKPCGGVLNMAEHQHKVQGLLATYNMFRGSNRVRNG